MIQILMVKLSLDLLQEGCDDMNKSSTRENDIVNQSPTINKEKLLALKLTFQEKF